MGTALLLTAIAAARIISTYRVFNHTIDEPAHLAAGMEWLEAGTYTFERLHPPLARIAVALWPFLDGLRLTGRDLALSPKATIWEKGNALLYAGGRYPRTLTLARLGVLPFFLLAAGVVWAWGQRGFGQSTAVVAVLLFTTLPPILAHGGLATTDMALTATLGGALLALTDWLERPTVSRSVTLGVTAALAMLAKYSALFFLPWGGGAAIMVRWLVTRGTARGPGPRVCRRLLMTALTAFTALLCLWAGFRFAARPYTSAAERPHRTINALVGASGTVHDLAYALAEPLPVPGLDLVQGLQEARRRAMQDSGGYLFGEIRPTGSWGSFPVAVAIKTPLPFLLVTAIGSLVLLRDTRRRHVWRPLVPVAMAATMLLASSLLVRLNIGLRHMLPVYPLLALGAAYGTYSLWHLTRSTRVGRCAVVGLLAWQLGGSAAVHPDYLAYFNALAGPHPEQLTADSDLDWGQDLWRMADTLRARGIDEIALAYWGSADPTQHHLPPFRPLLPPLCLEYFTPQALCRLSALDHPTSGWIAVGLQLLLAHGGTREALAWLQAYPPVALVGRSMRLYYIPPGSQTARAPITTVPSP